MEDGGLRSLVLNRLGVKDVKETIPVAVVIVGHNYARYLGDCIESVQRQNPAPKEIIYVDNASTDGSLELAASYGIKTAVVGTVERNICDCRNRGTALTSEPFLLFLDADDIIPKEYLLKLYSAIKPDGRIGIAYPDIMQFGIVEYPAARLKRAREEMLYENFVPGQSLISRRALLESGGWGNMPVFQDWELFLRITGRGWLLKFVPEAVYEHRTHADSLTSTWRLRMPWYQEVLWRQHLTVFTPFAPGRWDIQKKIFSVYDNLGLPWERTNMVLYDNTSNPEAERGIKDWLNKCPANGATYFKDNARVYYHDRTSRAMVVPERISEIWTNASKFFHGDFILSIEDDHEPYNTGVARRFYEGMAPDVDAVTGIYHSRPMTARTHVLALEWTNGRDGALMLRDIQRYPGDLPHPPSDGVTTIGASGVGFLLLRKNAVAGFEYDIGGPGKTYIGQDFGLHRHIKDRGKRLMAHWGLKCKHWYTADKWI